MITGRESAFRHSLGRSLVPITSEELQLNLSVCFVTCLYKYMLRINHCPSCVSVGSTVEAHNSGWHRLSVALDIGAETKTGGEHSSDNKAVM